MKREELIELVNKIININGRTEIEIDELIIQLKQNVPHPAITDLIYFENLTPEEIVDKALSYKPVLLPPSDQSST